MPADALSMRLASADPAREVEPDREAAEALLERVMSSPLSVAGERRSLRRRGLVLAVACLLALVVAAAALAAAGVISFGSPARSSGSLANPRQGLGALALGTARVLPVATPDPTGGLAWGIRVLSTTRGVGCIEFGRLLEGRLGVTGSDGAFGNDGKFHELPAGGLANGGKCANLDAQGRLFDTVSAFGVPASGWQGQGSCTPPLPTGAPGSCRPADLRDLYYGLLGPEATRLTYQLHGQLRAITPAGPEGAYLIVERHSSGAPSHRRYLGGAIDSIMPLPWSSPIVSITYRDGTVCHIAATQPGTFKGRCTPRGYQPAHAQVLTDAQVAATIHVSVVATRAGDRAPAAMRSASASPPASRSRKPATPTRSSKTPQARWPYSKKRRPTSASGTPSAGSCPPQLRASTPARSSSDCATHRHIRSTPTAQAPSSVDSVSTCGDRGAPANDPKTRGALEGGGQARSEDTTSLTTRAFGSPWLLRRSRGRIRTPNSDVLGVR
jgi:hypothetical protein